MTSSIDVYAATNPAFLGIVICQFVVGYTKKAARGPEYSLLFLPAAIAASSTLSQTFNGTNAKTGIANWYLSNPIVQTNLIVELQHAIEYSRSAIMFAMQSESLLASENGRIRMDASAFAKKVVEATNKKMEERPFATAERFGQWCGQIDSARSIFALLGVRP